METQNSTNPQINFLGKGSDLFGISIVNIILTVLTLGLYYPWAKASTLKYLYQETELDGSRFFFHGTGKEMFKGFIKAVAIFIVLYAIFLLAIFSKNLTLTILGTIFLYVSIILLIPFAIHGSMRYRMSRSSWRGIHFGYRGNRGEFVKEFLIGVFFMIITLGIYSPWFTIKIRKYLIDNIRFGNIKFHYTGKGTEYFILIVSGYFLTIFTLGIYLFWFVKDLLNYFIENTKLEQNGKTIDLQSTLTGGKYFRLAIVNVLIIIFSLGLASPWATIRTLKFIFSNIIFEGELDLNSINQTEEGFTDATGEDLTDILDLDIAI